MDTVEFRSDMDELNTEEKIKHAARKIFLQKGYAGTKTRDIAEEAGINIASLHYYFRSKEKLFEIVAGEAAQKLSGKIDEVLSGDLSIEEKIHLFVHEFSNFLLENPFLPLFILSEAQTNPKRANKILNVSKKLNFLALQLEELAEKGNIRPVKPVQLILNLSGLTTFPFIVRPILVNSKVIDEDDFKDIIEARKKMIPDLILGYLKQR